MTWMGRSAERRLDPQKVLPGAKSLVVVSAAYRAPAKGPWERGETSLVSHPVGYIAAYARYDDYHEILKPGLRELVRLINALGGPGAHSLAYTDTGPILERDFAQRAGLGFIGKHTNLISRRAGNWTLLGEVLTTVALQPDAPEHNRCGRCVRCMQVCPTQAIVAPFELDAQRCISYLTIEFKGAIPEPLRPALGTRVFGCDDCLAVCPWNRFAREGAILRRCFRGNLENASLLPLLGLDDEGFRRLFSGTPVERTGRVRLLRNVCVALGNAGDLAAVPALRKASRETDPLIAEHAAWALRRLGA